MNIKLSSFKLMPLHLSLHHYTLFQSEEHCKVENTLQKNKLDETLEVPTWNRLGFSKFKKIIQSDTFCWETYVAVVIRI